MGLYNFTFYNVIKRNADTFKNKEAWHEVDDGRTVTFAEYKEMVDHLACGLQQSGINKGDRIGVTGKNSLEFFLLYGAAAAVGAIVLPINWRLSPDEMAFNLNDGEPKLIFSDQDFQDAISGQKNHLASAAEYYNLGSNEGTFSDFKALMDNDGIFEPAELSDDDGYIIIHTAAIEGRPRGALLSHGNILCANMHFCYNLGIREHDIHLSFVPLFHVGGLFMTLSSFQSGALNLNMSGFDPAKAVEIINGKKASHTMVFSPILSSILEAQKKSGLDISSLKTVIGIEAPDIIEKYQELTGGSFYSNYGQTETSCMAASTRYNNKPGSAGRVIPLAEVRLVDDYDQPVAQGKTGEITMKGPMIFRGYWNLPKETEYTFRDGWHHTGDLGQFDEDGYLWYKGRKPEKELIKPGGENVYPAEVEKVILQHPAVEKTVVFGVPDPKWKEGIKAVCQLKQGQSLESKELIDFVGEKIARFKRPQHVEFVTDLPLLGDSSPDREKIKELYGG